MAAFVFSPEFDHVFLESMYDNDLDYAGEVFSGFLKETKNEVEALMNHYGNGNVTGFRQTLHKIKPTFSFVGLTGLTEKCEELISFCDKITEMKLAEPQWTSLSAEFEKAFILVDQELERMKKHI
jgi:Hpt domain